jgi:hypothetical protein
MSVYTCQFQHPQTGHGCEARYAFGHVTFEVDSIEEFLAEGWCGDVEDLKKTVEETRTLIERTVGSKKPIRATSLDEANQIVHSVAREQFNYGLEED